MLRIQAVACGVSDVGYFMVQMMSGRVGIFGGTFDPIHYGHLAIAEEARSRLGLDRVILVPTARQPFKHIGPGATGFQRVEMVRLACVGNGVFDVSMIEVCRPGLSYTVDTLEELSTKGLGELYFILGADVLMDLSRWRDVERIVVLARIVAIGRPGYVPDVSGLFQRVPSLQARLTLLQGPQLDISSSALRRRVAEGLSIRYQTPDAVVAYIMANGLYR